MHKHAHRSVAQVQSSFYRFLNYHQILPVLFHSIDPDKNLHPVLLFSIGTVYLSDIHLPDTLILYFSLHRQLQKLLLPEDILLRFRNRL